MGSTTVDVSSHLADATNVFGFTFSCQRPGRPVHSAGDLITIIGPMAAPVGPTYTIGGTVGGLTGTGLVLRNNGGNDRAIAADGAFTFATPVNAGSTYNVSVFTQPSGQSCTVTNGSGTANAPVTNVAVNCVAVSAAQVWQGAGLLENIDGDAYSPRVVFDANGNGMAIWVQHDGTHLRIRSSRYTPIGGWGPMMPVDSGGAGALSPEIAVDGSGNMMAVWLQSVTAQTTSIWTNLYNPVSGWGTATVLEASVSSVGGNRPQVAMDPAGNATVVWYAFDGTWTNLWARRYTAGGAWDTATLIENDNNGGVAGHGVVMDANGNAMVVWSQFDFVGQRINALAKRYVVGSGWEITPTAIEVSDLNASVSDIALDGSGNIMVVLHQQTSAISSTDGNLYTNRFSSGSWGTATLVKSDLPYLSQSAIAMNAGGNAMLTWLEDDGFDITSIWARAYNAAGVGGALLRIDDLTPFITTHRMPQVAMDASGNAVAVWGQGNHIWSARYVAGMGWEAPANIDNVAGNFQSNQPRIAVDASGNALAVWERSNGTVQSIWANVFR